MLRLGLLTAISLLLVPAGFSQTVARKPLPTEPLEKYDNPPAVAAPVLGISPALVSRLGPYVSYQVNVDANGNNIVGDAANEPSIAVDPTNRRQDDNRLAAVQQRHVQFPAGRFWHTRHNGGTTWTFPGVLENNVFRSDPVLDSDASRTFFLSQPSAEHSSMTMWRSLNGGQSWTNIGPAKGGDKQWFTIDNNQQHRSRIPIPVLEHRRQQLRRPAIHAVRPTAGSPG